MDTQQFTYYPPLTYAPTVFVDPAQFASPTTKIATATGLPEWLIIGAAVGVAAWLLLKGVR